MVRPNEQQEKTGILASLDHRAPSRRTLTWPLRTAFVVITILTMLATAFWAAQRGTQLAARPAAIPIHEAGNESPASSQPEMAAAIINEPGQPALAKASAPPAQQTSPPVVRIPRHVKRASPPRSTAPEDSDIALLAALVAHRSISDKDIVERYNGANTAVLVQRCRRLGGTEGELCEARICSGAAKGEAPCSAR